MIDLRTMHPSTAARLRALWPSLALVTLLPLGMGNRGCEQVGRDDCADGGVGRDCKPAVCRYEGKRYESGDSFPSSDGCNTCHCDDDGAVACTERACAPSGCDYEGEQYEDGDSFPASDGCNDCTCQDGAVACTLKACASCEYEGEYHAVGESFMASDGCNTCSCQQDGQVACTLRVCAGCDYGGDRYAVGDSLTSDNGCNSCICQPDGSWECTGDTCEPREVCGGIAGLPCEDGEYCNYAPDALCGAADATGFCATIPEACTTEHKPVCGCDDKTYGNACEAAAAGVSVASKGECDSDPTAQVCGGIAGLACADGQYCNYTPEALCGAADATGICAEIPSACTREYRPVCGCDDTTYSNPCTAASAGVSVAREGECDENSSGQACGGLGGGECQAGQFCNYAPEAQCGAADATGICTPIPDACTLEYLPVCGCDDETYPNACAARAAGVSIVSTSACP